MQKDQKSFFGAAYYFGLKSTRHINLKKWQINMLWGVVVGSVAWNICSLAWIVFITFEQSKLTAALEKTRNQIFELQVVYNHTFEKAYHNETHINQLKALGDTIKTEAPKAPENKSSVALALEKAPTETEGKKAETPTSEMQKVINKIDNIIAKDALPLAVNSVKSEIRNNDLDFSFQLLNKNKRRKASGFMWLVLKRQGSDVLETYPRGVGYNGKDDFKNIRLGRRFSLRNFSKYTFNLDPSYNPSEIQQATLYISDRGGEIQLKKGVYLKKPNKKPQLSS